MGSLGETRALRGWGCLFACDGGLVLGALCSLQALQLELLLANLQQEAVLAAQGG